jgi:hypothetical protein
MSQTRLRPPFFVLRQNIVAPYWEHVCKRRLVRVLPDEEAKSIALFGFTRASTVQHRGWQGQIVSGIRSAHNGMRLA